MSVLVDSERDLLAQARRIAGDVASACAGEVDRDARFPQEAIDALRAAGALSAGLPESLGGGGCSLETIARCCFELARGCSSTAMVFAMHQIQVLTMARHLGESAWFEGYLRELARDGRLVASVTSEVGTGGDMARSIAAVTPADDGSMGFEKQATTVSYGAYADDLFTTVRRAPDAEESDQVLVLTRSGQHQLEQTGAWDTLGMRGTCSPGFLVRASFAPEQILAAPFAQVMNQSLVPLSHVMTELTLLRAEVAQAFGDYVAFEQAGGRERLMTMASILRFNSLKLAASERSPRVCEGALEAIGIVGYRNDTPYSVGRHLRDALSARLMVANERLHATDASLLLIAKEA